METGAGRGDLPIGWEWIDNRLSPCYNFARFWIPTVIEVDSDDSVYFIKEKPMPAYAADAFMASSKVLQVVGAVLIAG